MRNEIVVVVLALVISGSVGLGYFAGVSNRQVITPTSTKLRSPTTQVLTAMGACGNLTQPQPEGHDVMLLAPGSVGIACLFFGVNSTQQAQMSQDIQQVGSVYSLSHPDNLTLAKGINITILSVTSTARNETVEYLIRATGNSTGAYTWLAPGTCQGFPLVVGSNITSALPNLRPYLSEIRWCPAILFIPYLDGVSSMTLEPL